MADNDLLKLSTELGAALKSRGWTLVLAESCTGGWLAQSVTAIAGSSAWFDRGFVTYSNAAKIEVLGVTENTLNQHGAVSEQTAGEMALGALEHSHANIATAITGIAGPDGGTRQKPIGTVCFAWATTDGHIKTVTRQLAGDRGEVRRKSVKTALEVLLQLTLSSDL